MSIMTTEEFVNLMMRWGNFKARIKSDFAKSEYAEKNRELKNKYKGERCFIIGNGASIREQDLSLLRDEITFVANGFCKYDKYPEISPDYYLMLDSAFFRSDSGKIMCAEIVKNLKKYNYKPVFILPYGVREIVQDEYQWNDWATVYYIDGSMSFVDGDTKPWDITKTVPSPQNVVQVAILLATYMGFEEINLLGIEQTNVIDNIYNYLGKTIVHYAYEEDKEAAAVALKASTLEPLEKQLLGYARIFHLYREIYHLCQAQGIKVYNCTPGSLVDSIPYRNYEEIFGDIRG